MNTFTTICYALCIICYSFVLITIFRLKEDNDELINRNKELFSFINKITLSFASVLTENEKLKKEITTERKKLHALQKEYFNDQETAVKLEKSAEKFMDKLPEGETE